MLPGKVTILLQSKSYGTVQTILSKTCTKTCFILNTGQLHKSSENMLCPALSVVVPVYNAGERVYSLVTALEGFFMSRNAELVLVDDCSTDQTIEYLRRIQAYRPWLRVYSMPRNRGQHYATLFGLQQARAIWCLTIDDDLPVPLDEVAKLLAFGTSASLPLVYGQYRRQYGDIMLRQVGSIAVSVLLRLATGKKTVPSPLRLLQKNIVPGELPGQGFFLDLHLLRNAEKAGGMLLKSHKRTPGRYSARKLLGMFCLLVKDILFYRPLAKPASQQLKHVPGNQVR